MDLEELKNKIVNETNLSKEDVEKKIEEKVLELSNLVSEEGAAYIIAKEEGLDLLEKRDRTLKIKNIIPRMNNIEILGKILDISELKEFERQGKKGKVQHINIGDETGKIRVVFWNDKTDLLKGFKEGETVRVKNGFTKANTFGMPEIHMGKGSTLEKEEKEIEVKEMKNETKEMYKSLVDRKSLKDLKENDFAEVKGIIASISEKEFVTCPQCDSRLEEINENLVCKDHGKVEPKRNLILRGYLDDGTSTFRFVSFRETAEKIKNENLLGKERLFIGRVKKNEYFGDLEMIINQIRELDIEEEIEKLK